MIFYHKAIQKISKNRNTRNTTIELENGRMPEKTSFGGGSQNSMSYSLKLETNQICIK